MPIKLQLDNPEHLTAHTLIHGMSNAGKTYLLGSAMEYCHKQGKRVAFINLKGEDGYRTLTAFDLPVDCAMTATDFADLQACLAEVKGTDLVCLDSAKYIWQFAIDKKCGAGKLPKVGGQSNDWSEIHKMAEMLLKDLMDQVGRVVVACPSDRSMVQEKQEVALTPDLPGRWAAGIAGAFDLVGYLEANAMGSKVRRVLNLQPIGGTISKGRFKTELTKGIVLESGTNAWEQVEKALEAHL